MEEVPNHEVVVGYFRTPYGNINFIPIDERGWVYLERFITMLKAAMLQDEDFDKFIFANDAAPRAVLFNGAQQLCQAAQDSNSALMHVLESFKSELFTYLFSLPYDFTFDFFIND